MNNVSNIILGIDPGTIVMGYAIIAVNKSEPKMIVMDVLKLNAKKDAYERLQKIHATVSELITQIGRKLLPLKHRFMVRTCKVC